MLMSDPDSNHPGGQTPLSQLKAKTNICCGFSRKEAVIVLVLSFCVIHLTWHTRWNVPKSFRFITRIHPVKSPWKVFIKGRQNFEDDWTNLPHSNRPTRFVTTPSGRSLNLEAPTTHVAIFSFFLFFFLNKTLAQALARLAFAFTISSSSYEAFKGFSQQLLPCFITTKRKLSG